MSWKESKILEEEWRQPNLIQALVRTQNVSQGSGILKHEVHTMYEALREHANATTQFLYSEQPLFYLVILLIFPDNEKKTHPFIKGSVFRSADMQPQQCLQGPEPV